MGKKVVMKTVYWLNAKPPSSLNKAKLPDTWTIRKRLRKSPVKAINHFFPTDELRNSNKFVIILRYSRIIEAKFKRIVALMDANLIVICFDGH